MNFKRLFFISAIALCTVAPFVKAEIISGPMLGPTQMREATIWVQTENASIIRVQYRDENEVENWSTPIETNSATANTATIRLSKVKPGQTYNYTVEVNGKLTDKGGTFKTPTFYHERTPPPDFRFAVGGSHYAIEEGYELPYRILGGDYSIFETIYDSKPDLMIWAGNTATLRETDWTTQSGYLSRYTHARSLPEMQSLLANVPQLATWAKTDYAISNTGKFYAQRKYAKNAFQAFWPSPVEIPDLNGIMTRYRYSDVDFIFLDVRSKRINSVTSDSFPAVLGSEQIEWLRQELVTSTATFKIIVAGAPVLNPAESPSNLSSANYEQNKLLEMLRSARVPGIFFISGGKSNGELTRLVHANSYNLYDLTVGPMTAKPEADDELNFFRMPGTNTVERQFTLVDVSGPENDRQLLLRVMNIDGQEIWSRAIKADQLERK